MSNITGPVCKMCRREGVKLFLKGEKCFSKCVLEKRPYPPGSSGKARSRKKTTDFGLRLREKQRLKRMMLMNEAQMRGFYEKAKDEEGRTGQNLLHRLELRLDNVVRRLGLAVSPRFARQLVSHGHILVNGQSVNLPAYQVQPGDRLALNPKLKENYFVTLAAQGFDRRASASPSWIAWDRATAEGEVIRWPEKNEVSFPVNDQYIVEFYTRR
ncbi:MAG: 30S ribosomal protein S4 [Elusimicrobia bacterium]|nr:30S ribosomal protein S4 [Elusimicrobiota bacterium]